MRALAFEELKTSGVLKNSQKMYKLRREEKNYPYEQFETLQPFQKNAIFISVLDTVYLFQGSQGLCGQVEQHL